MLFVSVLSRLDINLGGKRPIMQLYPKEVEKRRERLNETSSQVIRDFDLFL
jgi:hypothetical protein